MGMGIRQFRLVRPRSRCKHCIKKLQFQCHLPASRPVTLETLYGLMYGVAWCVGVRLKYHG